MPPAPSFLVVLRGYSPQEVDAVVGTALAALESTDTTVRSSAVALIGQANFRVQLRGYDRSQVQAWLDQIRAELEQSR